MKEITVKVHSIEDDGLPNMEQLSNRVAFIFDGLVVSGWPIEDEDGNPSMYEGEVEWEANTDVGEAGGFISVTHWIEFPVPVGELEK